MSTPFIDALLRAGTLKNYQDFRTGSLRDISGNATTVAATGNCAFKNGRGGLGIVSSKFNGVNPGIAVNNAAALLTSGVYWISYTRTQPQAVGTGLYNQVFICSSNYSLMFNGTNYPGMYSYGGVTGFKNSTYQLTDDKPHVYAVKFMSGVANGTRWFVDGTFTNAVTWTSGGAPATIILGYGPDGVLNSSGGTIQAFLVSSDTTMTDDTINQVGREIAAGKCNLVPEIRSDRFPTPLPLSGAYFSSDGTLMGGKLQDLSGNNNNLTLYNNPMTVAGPFDKALQYLETRQSWASNAAITGASTTAITYEVLVKPTTAVGVNHAAVVTNANNGGIYGIASTSTWRFELQFTTAGIVVASPTNITFNVGQWHHLLLTWSSGGKIKGYMNGVQIAIGAANITDTIVGTGTLSLGKYVGYASEDIASVVVYNRELSVDEIASRYQQFQRLLRYRLDMSAVPTTLANVTAGQVPGTQVERIAGTWSVVQDTASPYAKRLNCAAAGDVCFRQSSAYGTWVVKMSLVAGAGSIFASLMQTQRGAWNTALNNGYILYVNKATNTLVLARVTNGAVSAAVGSTAAAYVANAVEYTYIVTRTKAGVWNVYIKGGAYAVWTLAIGPATDTTHTTTTHSGFSGSVAGDKFAGPTIFEEPIDPTILANGQFIDSLT